MSLQDSRVSTRIDEQGNPVGRPSRPEKRRLLGRPPQPVSATSRVTIAIRKDRDQGATPISGTKPIEPLSGEKLSVASLRGLEKVGGAIEPTKRVPVCFEKMGRGR